MKITRIFPIVLLDTLCFGVLTGCGTNDPARWQDTLHLKTYDEVQKVLGKPDTPKGTLYSGMQYRNVSFTVSNSNLSGSCFYALPRQRPWLPLMRELSAKLTEGEKMLRFSPEATKKRNIYYPSGPSGHLP